MEWKRVDDDEAKWELFKAWQRLGELFPVFEKECHWQKFVSVVSRYQRDWAPFSGSGRKMVKVFVAERAGTTSKASAAQDKDSDTDHEFPRGIEASNLSWHHPLLPSGASLRIADAPQGEITPPTRGRSPLSVVIQDQRQNQQPTSSLVDLLVAAGALGPSAGVISMSVAAGISGSVCQQGGKPWHLNGGLAADREQTTRLSVADLLSPAPTSSASTSTHTLGPADYCRKVPRPVEQYGRSEEGGLERPAKMRKKHGVVICEEDKDDPLHVLLDALTKQV